MFCLWSVAKKYLIRTRCTRAMHDTYEMHPMVTHRDQPFAPGDGKDGVVTMGSSSSRVYEKVDILINNGSGTGLGEHDVEMRRLEELLTGVEGEPTQLALYKVGSVLHDSLEFDVQVRALPPASSERDDSHYSHAERLASSQGNKNQFLQDDPHA